MGNRDSVLFPFAMIIEAPPSKGRGLRGTRRLKAHLQRS
jgi:hypothetical protein